jgi:hypothetical protein
MAALRAALVGLLVGSLVSISFIVARWLPGWSVSPWFAGAALALMPLLGGALGLCRRHGWAQAAAAVDAHYELKDRTVTALDFLTRSLQTTWHQLQVQDTVRRLDGVEPRRVVPLRLPRAWPWTAAALVFALALLVWPSTAPPAEARPPEPLPEIVAEADLILEDLTFLEGLARQEQDEELVRAIQMMRVKAEEMKQPGADLREVLAQLSEMQAALAAQQAQYNVPLVDEQLRDLGAAMTPAEALQKAGKALEEGRFDRAAEELNQLDGAELSRKEARAVEEKMKQAAQAMKDKRLAKLSAAASKMAEGAKGDKEKLQQGAKEMAKQVQQHAQRKRLQELLAVEQNRLGECKSRVQKTMLSWLNNPNKGQQGSQKQGGSQQQNQSAARSQAGAQPGGDPFGDKTDLASRRKLQEIKGKAGEGPSETETTRALEGPEGVEGPGPSYRDSYQKYRRMSESVLDTEPIPLGHRQTIRRYFELIRPENLEADKKTAPPGSP